MTNARSERSVFYRKNEREQNLIALQILKYTPLAGIAMVAGAFAGVFSGSPVLYGEMTLILLIQSVLMRVFCKRNPGHPALKYYLVITTELVVFLLTIARGFEPFIIYVLAPLLSCLYFDRNFCLFSACISYVAMLISVVIRAQPENPLGEGLSSLQWGIEYGIGLTIEFLLNFGILRLVSLRHFDVLDENLQAIETFQVTQDELIAGYSGLIVQAHHSRKVDVKRCQAVVIRLCEMLRDHSDFKELQNEDVVKAIVSCVPLHDIGLIGVSDAIISKTSSYTEQEKAEYQKHVVYGEELIRKNFYLSENREFLMIARMSALHHHERWDGTGYPEQLFGIMIPLSARLIAAADELELRVSGDNEHPPVSFEMALKQIQKLSGTVLDPVIVEAMLSSRGSLEELYTSTPLPVPQLLQAT